MIFYVSIGPGGISPRFYTPPHVQLISCTKALLDLLRHTMSLSLVAFACAFGCLICLASTGLCLF